MPESAVLFRLAAQLDDHADVVRGRAARLELAHEQLHWHSLAADAFRVRADRAAGALRRSATGIDHAASSLRHHARTVRRLEEAAAAVAHAGEHLAHGVNQVARTVSGWL